jgi:hypothetical protein
MVMNEAPFDPLPCVLAWVDLYFGADGGRRRRPFSAIWQDPFSEACMQTLKTVSSWLLSNGGILMGGISGIFSVFSDGKQGRLWKVLPIVGVVAGMLWALASANFADRQQREQMEGAINRVDTYVQKQSLETVSQVDANTRAALQEFMQKDLGVLPNVAEGASPQRTLAIVDAGTKASVLIRAVPQQQRDALTIWVFTHVQKEVDFTVVRARLQQLAGKVEVHAPLHPETEANSVWWSDGATLSEAKAAALTAVSAGLEIKQICPSTTVQMKNLIQIGGSVGAQRLPILSPSQIESLTGTVCQQAVGQT